MTPKTLAVGPKIKTALPGPNAQRVLAGDEKYISPSYTRSYPLVAKSGRGIVVTDVDGNEFFDFSAGIAVNSTGHSHPQKPRLKTRDTASAPTMITRPAGRRMSQPPPRTHAKKLVKWPTGNSPAGASGRFTNGPRPLAQAAKRMS